MADFDSYVICTSPRSGSTLLCKLLAATGVAGHPASHFHEPSIDAWLGYYDLSPDASQPEPVVLEAIFKAAVARGSGATGMFGLRLQRGSFAFFFEKLAVLHPGHSSDIERLEAAFGRTCLIHLTRRGKIEQAVSLVKAEQSGLWHQAPDGTELERLSPPQEPAYDRDRLQAAVEELTGFDRQWESWFAREGVEVFCLTYEQLSADPLQALKDVLAHLGRDRAAAEGIEPGVAKLADATSQEWIRRLKLGVP